ncbi:hypothetical protein [Flavobacterium algoritolerans]|uniref:Uncharacterized protein n=1 Tax=Flavobacterium algoritolerans TaxID=3041254 RepID=A0ABT6V827_9FLAO|nr:hypothetical protein [Flavobacterium algoritolerans]MDI5894370.1 hypothetical protein [Flavobacterium algoritolerans]
MAEFNKVKALDEIMEIFKLGPNPTFSENMNAMITAQNYLEVIHLESFQKGLEQGLKKIDLENDSN